MVIKEKLNSSAINEFLYDTESETLTIVFKGNRPYDYYNVPMNVVDGLRRAESAGKYFNSVVKHYSIS